MIHAVIDDLEGSFFVWKIGDGIRLNGGNGGIYKIT